MRPDGRREAKYEMTQLGRSTREEEEEERRMIRTVESQPMAVAYANSRPSVGSVGYEYGNDGWGSNARSVGYGHRSDYGSGSCHDHWRPPQVESPRQEKARIIQWEEEQEEDVSQETQLGRHYRTGSASHVGDTDGTPRRRSARLAAKATQSR